MNSCDITEQYLNKCYEDFSNDQMRLMTEMKNNTKTDFEKDKDADITKQITMLNALMLGVMRLRNLKNKIIAKLNA
jgi:hypothetical protein